MSGHEHGALHDDGEVREMTVGQKRRAISDEPAPEGKRLIGRVQRLNALDAHRGLIIVLMAIDHASMFIARAHSQEFWGVALPVYPDAYWFLTRWITHPCAPGFFFLMGMGMRLFAEARSRAGWGEGRITRFFVIRGLLLIVLQLLVEDAAWMVGDLPAETGHSIVRGGGIPGGGGDWFVYLGVLYALGGTMVFWAFLIRSSPWLMGTLSVAAIMITQFVVPGSDQSGTLYSPILRLFLIPGRTNVLIVFYPLIPWLGVTGLGMVFTGLVKADSNRAERIAGLTGIGLLLFFILIRVCGGFGNLNEVPAGWMGFLNVVKYPPSLAFLTMTLGLNFLLISCWGVIGPALGNPHHPLLVFGRTALFFYLVHLWVYGLIGFFFPEGSSLPVMYVVWLSGLVILYPLCYWFDRCKRTRPLTSLWRFL
jgi:uncharacterized membrane protein